MRAFTAKISVILSSATVACGISHNTLNVGPTIASVIVVGETSEGTKAWAFGTSAPVELISAGLLGDSQDYVLTVLGYRAELDALLLPEGPVELVAEGDPLPRWDAQWTAQDEAPQFQTSTATRAAIVELRIKRSTDLCLERGSCFGRADQICQPSCAYTPPPPDVAAPNAPVFGPCPAGWTEVVDPTLGPRCEPWAQDRPPYCGPQQAIFPGERRCHLLGDPCPADQFAPGLPASTLFVNGTAAAGGNGTRLAPYQRIAAALAASRPGMTIALAPGSYAEAVVLPDGISLRGACAAETTIAGPPTGVVVDLVGSASVAGLSIVGGQTALRAGSGRQSLRGLCLGQRVEGGERFAAVGAPPENGDWWPHVHVQIITDMLDVPCNVNGVAPASQRRTWLSLSPDPNLMLGIPPERLARHPATAALLERRVRRFGGNVRLSYAHHPLQIVRGWMQYLFDETGRTFIDGYNNVPHVGHAHPRVTREVAAQLGTLNTNTRYLHEVAVRYAEELTSTFPSPLEVCYFTASGSEANELALRLARASTGHRDLIVMDGAYHGHTTTLIDISPYKHAGPGGAGAPDWVHVSPIPDVYRGAHKAGDPEAGRKYARAVGDVIGTVAARGRGLCAYIAETCPSVGGQILMPPGFLPEVYRLVRQAGGVCIADEVQTGFGRLGTHFWAFETLGVTPDIVVLGKPIANGYPMGAVVTTRAIADGFDNGMEFFSTFGGSTAACVAGLTTLHVTREEQLQDHARRVGAHLLADLRALQRNHELIGDVRGSGLFVGVELVRDRASLEPATEEAGRIVNRMRELGVLVGTDGPHHNVIKIRGPMPLGLSDIDCLVAAFERALRES